MKKLIKIIYFLSAVILYCSFLWMGVIMPYFHYLEVENMKVCIEENKDYAVCVKEKFGEEEK